MSLRSAASCHSQQVVIEVNCNNDNWLALFVLAFSANLIEFLCSHRRHLHKTLSNFFLHSWQSLGVSIETSGGRRSCNQTGRATQDKQALLLIQISTCLLASSAGKQVATLSSTSDVRCDANAVRIQFATVDGGVRGEPATCWRR